MRPFSLINGNVTSLADLHKGTVIFMALLSFLVITLLITNLVNIYYKHSHQQNLDTGIPQMHYYVGVIIAIMILPQVISYALGESYNWIQLGTYSLGALVVQLVIIFENDQQIPL